MKYLSLGFFSILPIVYLQVLRLTVGGEQFSFSALLIQLAFIIVEYILSHLLLFKPNSTGIGLFNFFWIIYSALILISGGISWFTRNQLASWVCIITLFSISIGIADVFSTYHTGFSWCIRIILLGGITALIPVLLNQSITRFSEEEFYSALQTSFTFILWVLLLFAHIKQSPYISFQIRSPFQIKLIYPSLIGLIFLVSVGLVTLHSYRTSFYTRNVTTYPGITPDSPFLCGSIIPQSTSSPANDLRQVYIQRALANPELQPPDMGLLYLFTDDPRWAKQFHDGLLLEASRKLFTFPANSVKYDQYLASFRVYAYSQVIRKDPELFTRNEQTIIENWFHAINRRAMTVEWVDWMYGLAFSYWPEGPYENQENGAGLISLLEAYHLGDPALHQRNIAYLAHNRRGWQARFHNTDDSINYQSEWINNAFFQSLYTHAAVDQNIKNSFEWLFLQMLPDGRAPQYNLPNSYALTDTLIQGASFLQDGRYSWLAKRALNTPANEKYKFSIPVGVDPSSKLPVAISPSQGSCLIYSNSGLPTQAGPLAPDKIVFRNGWADKDSFMLLNLRFTGWHRYKGTNTITLIDKGGPLVSDDITGTSIAWLPRGRSAFRDKRIPRENLNGLLIPRQGLDAVLHQLIGYGGPWAQDPPFYADVVSFTPGSEIDISQTKIANWDGWSQTRSIYFVHSGIIVIDDGANGPKSQSAAINWNFIGGKQLVNGRFVFINNDTQAELLLIGQPDSSVSITEEYTPENHQMSHIHYTSPGNGYLHLITIILTNEWMGSEATLQIKTDGMPKLVIQHLDQVYQLDLTARQ